VTARIIDVPEFNRIASGLSSPARIADILSAGTETRYIGELAKGTVRTLPQIILRRPQDKDQVLNIFFNARNGLWTQTLRLHKDGDSWFGATRVFRQALGKVPGTADMKLLELVDKGYPRDKSGKVDWTEPKLTSQ
jgi:hypothetical protein